MNAKGEICTVERPTGSMITREHCRRPDDIEANRIRSQQVMREMRPIEQPPAGP
jgi:hypothetical protein